MATTAGGVGLGVVRGQSNAGSGGTPPAIESFMLMEDGSYVLREDGSKVILE